MVPISLARTWTFCQALKARGFTDAEIGVSLAPAMTSVAANGVVEDSSLTPAISVTVTRGQRSWTHAIYSWPDEMPKTISELWGNFVSMVQSGKLPPQVIAQSAGPAWDPAWLKSRLEGAGLLAP